MSNIDGIKTLPERETTVDSILELLDQINPTVGLRKDVELDLLRLKDRGFKLQKPALDPGQVTVQLVKENVPPLRYVAWDKVVRVYIVLDGTVVYLDTASFWKFVFK